MPWKTIFCALSNPAGLQTGLAQAAKLAAHHQAHLEVLCIGVAHEVAAFYLTGVGAEAGAMTMDKLYRACHDEAQALDKAVRDQLAGQPGVDWSCDVAVAHLADLGYHVARRARFADLAVLPAPYADDAGPEAAAITEATLFEGGIPTLVLPPTIQDMAALPKKLCLAWDESPEALNATRAALPLLSMAERVHLVVVDPPVHGPGRSDPGGTLAQYLARHGVVVEIDVLSKTLPRVGDILLRRASDTGAEAIVMGAYGHSRLREAVFGGTTRYMLENAKLPLFMAH